MRLLFRPQVEGAEHIPTDGAAILASNHLSFSDSIFLPLMVERRITFLAKADYFTGEGIKGRLTAAFFKAMGQVPVDRPVARRATRPSIPACGSCVEATFSASTPRAPARPTVVSIADEPAWPGWRWKAR